MKSLVAEGHYQAAAEIADTINWRKIKNVTALVRAGEIYEQVRRYGESREILLMAYDRSPIGRAIVYRLSCVAVKMGNYDEAKEYYDEFVKLAPHDNLKYVLKYEINKAECADYPTLISILEDLKEQEFSEEWGYELAYLYHQAGRVEQCVEACDELALYFGQGTYVEKALELKMLYQPLTPQQEEKYRQFRNQKEGVTEVRPEDVLESGEIVTEAVQIPEIEMPSERFNTQSLQEVLRESMQMIRDATEKETVEDHMDNIKKIFEDIPYLQIPEEKEEEPEPEIPIPTNKELENTLRLNFQEALNNEAHDGQMRIILPGGKVFETYVTRQMTVEEIFQEWDSIKQAAEAALLEVNQKKLESAKAKALQETADIMERLADVIPKLESTSNKTSPNKILSEQEENKVAARVADMNRLLQKEIERLSTENAQIEEKIAVAQEYVVEEPLVKAEEILAEEIAIEEIAIKEIEPEEKVLDDILPEETAVEEITVEEFSIEENQIEENQIEEIFVEEISEKEILAEEILTEDASLEKILIDDISDEENFIKEVSIKEVSAEEISAEEIAIEEIPIEDFIAEEMLSIEKEALAETFKDVKLEEILPEIEFPEDYNEIEITELSEEQKEMFSYIIPIKGMEQQICKALSKIATRLVQGRSSDTGNLIVQGGSGSGKTVFATNFIKVLQQMIDKPEGKVGKIEASVLNQKDINVLFGKIKGGCLIVESAGDLEPETAQTLSILLEQDKQGTLVILEDSKHELEKVLVQNKRFASKFSERINIPIFTNDELIIFAKAYAAENGYVIDDMGILALYNCISNIQKIDRETTIAEVKEIVDDAIANVERGALKIAFSILTSSRFDEDDYVILHEKDFNN